MVLCENCRNALPDILCKKCEITKSISNFKPNSNVCNDCNKLRYNQWKEKNREKWCVGGQYYKYEKKKVESS